MGMGRLNDKRYGFGASGGDRVWDGVFLVMHVDEKRREMGLPVAMQVMGWKGNSLVT